MRASSSFSAVSQVSILKDGTGHWQKASDHTSCSFRTLLVIVLAVLNCMSNLCVWYVGQVANECDDVGGLDALTWADDVVQRAISAPRDMLAMYANGVQKTNINNRTADTFSNETIAALWADSIAMMNSDTFADMRGVQCVMSSGAFWSTVRLENDSFVLLSYADATTSFNPVSFLLANTSQPWIAPYDAVLDIRLPLLSQLIPIDSSAANGFLSPSLWSNASLAINRSQWIGPLPTDASSSFLDPQYFFALIQPLFPEFASGPKYGRNVSSPIGHCSAFVPYETVSRHLHSLTTDLSKFFLLDGTGVVLATCGGDPTPPLTRANQSQSAGLRLAATVLSSWHLLSPSGSLDSTPCHGQRCVYQDKLEAWPLHKFGTMWVLLHVRSSEDDGSGLSKATTSLILTGIILAITVALAVTMAHIFSRPMEKIAKFMSELHTILTLELQQDTKEISESERAELHRRQQAKSRQLQSKWFAATPSSPIASSSSCSSPGGGKIHPSSPSAGRITAASAAAGSPRKPSQSLHNSVPIRTLSRPSVSVNSSGSKNAAPDAETRHTTIQIRRSPSDISTEAVGRCCCSQSMLSRWTTRWSASVTEIEHIQTAFGTLLQGLCDTQERYIKANEATRHFIRYIFHEVSQDAFPLGVLHHSP